LQAWSAAWAWRRPDIGDHHALFQSGAVKSREFGGASGTVDVVRAVIDRL